VFYFIAHGVKGKRAVCELKESANVKFISYKNILNQASRPIRFAGQAAALQTL
jgi:hypothetical protein